MMRFTPSEVAAQDQFIEKHGFHNFPSLVSLALRRFMTEYEQVGIKPLPEPEPETETVEGAA